MNLILTGKTALVTAASGGLGSAVAEALAEAGVRATISGARGHRSKRPRRSLLARVDGPRLWSGTSAPRAARPSSQPRPWGHSVAASTSSSTTLVRQDLAGAYDRAHQRQRAKSFKTEVVSLPLLPLCRIHFRMDRYRMRRAGVRRFRIFARISRQPSMTLPRRLQNRRRESRCELASSVAHIDEHRLLPWPVWFLLSSRSIRFGMFHI